MKTIAIIQARLGSTRLPHKVLQDISGKTMLERVVDRVKRCETIDDFVIATSTNAADQLLIDFCKSQGWNYFAGSERDVLDRFVGAAHEFDADQIVRITSDCPLLEPSVVDKVVRLIRDDQVVDYGCNFFPQRSFPRGLDCEVFTLGTLHRLDLMATKPEHREHVTLNAYQNCDQFYVASTQAALDYSDYRWTVDTAEDLKLVRKIYEHFGEEKFTWRNILDAYQQHPHWHAINQDIKQKPTLDISPNTTRLRGLVAPPVKVT